MAATGFSGLLGKELSLISQRGTIGELFRTSETKLTGRIDRVVVIEDTETRLSFRVYFTGYAECIFECSLLNAEHQTIRDFRSSRPEGGDEPGAVNLVLDLDASYNRSQELTSEVLEIKVDRRKGRGGAVNRYTLAKRWRTRITAENLVIPVDPKPIGEAATLPRSAPLTPTAMAPAPEPAKPVVFLPVTLMATAQVPPKQVPPKFSVLADHQAAQTTIAPSVLAAAPRQVRASSFVSATKQHIATATGPAAELLPQNRNLARRIVMSKGLAAEEIQRGAQGPSSRQINLLETLRCDASLRLRPADLLAISPEIYLDRNPRSGLCYFRPLNYNLAWDSDSGYGMRMVYKAGSQEGQAGDVLVAARLGAGVDSSEIQLVRDLLQAYRARNPEFSFSEVRALPIEVTVEPKVSLSSGLQRLFDIPADRIALTSLADALAEIQIEWVNDAATRENLRTALIEDIGINGKVTLAPSGGGLGPQELPIQIKLAAPETFGFFSWQRGQKWRNPTPYPIRLKYLHVLLIESNIPVVYSWALGDAEIPSRARADFADYSIPPWLDGRAKRMWLQYTVRSSDPEGQVRAIDSMTSGATGTGPAQLVFRTLKPLADTAAYQINLKVRSRFFHPRNREVVEKPDIILDKDDKDYSIGAIYDTGRSPDEPLLEYAISAVLADGNSFQSARWIPVTGSTRVFIGRVQVEQATGHTFGTR